MVKSTGIVRKVDELGRVVLPIETRKQLGIEEKDAVEILMDEEKGQIIFQKVSGLCVRCRSTENLREIRPGWYICAKCIQELK